MLVILLFLLHGRSALVPLLTLPVVMLATFAAMWLFDVPASLMSLGGIGIALGIAVDADVVALEACHRRLEALGPAAAPEERRRQILAAAASLTPAIVIVAAHHRAQLPAGDGVYRRVGALASTARAHQDAGHRERQRCWRSRWRQRCARSCCAVTCGRSWPTRSPAGWSGCIGRSCTSRSAGLC